MAACGDGSPSSTQTPSLAPSGTASPVTPTATSIPSATGVQCGVERWPIKTLSDPDAAQVNFTPVQSSVTELRSLAPPPSLPQSSRIAPTELTAFTVTAQLVEMKAEEDHDIHLVIAEPADSTATMITEFPDADNCSVAVASARAQGMPAARDAHASALGSYSYTVIYAS